MSPRDPIDPTYQRHSLHPGRLLHRLRRALFGRSDFERQLDDDLRAHVEAEAAELVRQGAAPEDARRRAVAALGGYERWREEARETRITSWLEIVGRDARIALRGLLRSPSYSLPALATLALGSAAMATIATLAWDVLFRPLPYREPDRLVALYERNLPRKRDRNVVSAAAFTAWRERSRTVDSVSALMPASRVWRGGGTDDGVARVNGGEVSPSLFALLGRRPALGPGFSAGTPENEVIVSHAFWSTRLGGDSSVIGRAVPLGETPVTVVGVMPPDFEPLRFGWMGEQEFWLPFILTPQQAEWGRFLLVAARLRPGATFDGLQRELESIHAQLHADGSIAEGWNAHAFPLSEEIGGSVRAPVTALLVACAILLAMVLTNTALLTIAHARRRAGDGALRAVLGATRGRLVTERVVASVMLATAGAALGAALAAWAIPLLTRILPEDVPRLASVGFGPVALLVAGVTALVATIVLAAVSLSAMHAGTREGGGSTLQGGARLTRTSRTSWVMVSEAAAAVVLTLFASLTLRSFDRLASVDIGFDPARLLAFRVAFDAPATSAAFFERLRAMPGVVAAARTSVRPLYSGGTATTITPLGMGERDVSSFPTADVRFVDADFFETMALAPREGRIFSPGDSTGAPQRAVVNEAMLKALFPDVPSAVGRRFDVRVGVGTSPEIIGVVRDVHLASPRTAPRPTVYLSSAQFNAGEEYDVLVRTEGDEGATIPMVREAIRSVSPATPIFRVERMEETVGAAIARERVTAQLLVFFAAASLLLVAVGVYGLYAGEVTRRRQEIGVRLALGETAGGVVRAMMTRAMARTAAGVVAGVIVGLAASRVLQGVLFGVPPTDPLSLAGAGLLVVLVSLGATLVPALQAARVDPAQALRAE